MAEGLCEMLHLLKKTQNFFLTFVFRTAAPVIGRVVEKAKVGARTVLYTRGEFLETGTWEAAVGRRGACPHKPTTWAFCNGGCRKGGTWRECRSEIQRP